MENRHRVSAEDRFEIEALLFRFMRSFDDKDWTAMRACLSDTIDCDYSSFRGTPPSMIARDDYVSLRTTALASLKTQHNLSNITIVGSENTAEVKCNYAILRFHPNFDRSPDQYFHSYGQYRFGLARAEDQWRIASITQMLLTNEGNPALHRGAQR